MGAVKSSVSRSGLRLFIKVFIHYRHRQQKCVSRKLEILNFKKFFLYLFSFKSNLFYFSFIHLLLAQFSGDFFSHTSPTCNFWCKSSPVDGAIWTVYLLKMCICETKNICSVCAWSPDKEAEVLFSLPKVSQRLFLPLTEEERKALKIIIQAGTQSSHQEWAEPETHFQKSPKTSSAVAAINTKYSCFLHDCLEWVPGWWYP